MALDHVWYRRRPKFPVQPLGLLLGRQGEAIFYNWGVTSSVNLRSVSEATAGCEEVVLSFRVFYRFYGSSFISPSFPLKNPKLQGPPPLSGVGGGLSCGRGPRLFTLSDGSERSSCSSSSGAISPVIEAQCTGLYESHHKWTSPHL